jgi:hypothetical protein
MLIETYHFTVAIFELSIVRYYHAILSCNEGMNLPADQEEDSDRHHKSGP